ncbi:hypothetical protein HON52_01770 [Candidatus Uhrbacteria bacterium]|jgi:hypothetical protein|nr:hypothetical protein [Candidatus Uhrbacteria bacterium]
MPNLFPFVDLPMSILRYMDDNERRAYGLASEKHVVLTLTVTISDDESAELKMNAPGCSEESMFLHDFTRDSLLPHAKLKPGEYTLSIDESGLTVARGGDQDTLRALIGTLGGRLKSVHKKLIDMLMRLIHVDTFNPTVKPVIIAHTVEHGKDADMDLYKLFPALILDRNHPWHDLYMMILMSAADHIKFCLVTSNIPVPSPMRVPRP